MNNQQIVELLHNVSAALLIKGANRFRIIAYDKAATAIEHLTSEVKDIWEDNKLEEIPGVGKTIALHLDELMRTGRVKHFETLFEDISPALFVLLQVPGIGPKKADQLTKTFQIQDPAKAVLQLEKIAHSGKIAELEGWGEKSQSEVLSAIETYKRGQIKENRMPFPFADKLSKEIISYLEKIPGVLRIDCLGSLRRKVATIGDIDLAVSTKKPETVLDAFLKYPTVRKVIDRGPKGATVLLSIGRQVDLRVQDPSSYGAMLQYFTGSKHHNIKLREHALRQGLSLSEHGIKILDKVQRSSPPRRDPANQIDQMKAGKIKDQNYNSKLKMYEYAKEEEFYEAVGLKWIPPEIREDMGEIEASLRHVQGKHPGLPTLVDEKDIKGDLHIHSNYDLQSSHDVGSSSLEQLLQKAESLGYEYIGISDHNPKKSLIENKILTIMKRRKEYFEQIYSSYTKSAQSRSKKLIQLFTLLEVDIDPNGHLALPEKALEYVDAVLVSIHSSFNQSKEQMTKRIITGLSHPKAKIWAHPTARLIGSREGIDVDWEEVFGYCLEHGKALEINSWPERLDLPDRLVHEAVKKNVKLIINTDSHDEAHMENMRYGVFVAKRGWAQKENILNTMRYNEFSRWLK